MTDRVASLFGNPTGERVPNEDAVEHAERLLEAVRSGEIVGFAASVQYFDGAASFRLAGNNSANSVVGALERVKFLLLSDD